MCARVHRIALDIGVVANRWLHVAMSVIAHFPPFQFLQSRRGLATSHGEGHLANEARWIWIPPFSDVLDQFVGRTPVRPFTRKLSSRHTRRVSVHGSSVVMCASSVAEVRVIDTV